MVTAMEASPTFNPTIPQLTLPVDAEHGGIRMAGCATFLLGSVLSFVLGSVLLPSATGIMAIVSLFAGAFIAYVVDQRLRGRWLSGRTLSADANQIAIVRQSEPEFHIDPRKQVNVMTWRFEVPRNGRVKKGWFVAALALEQDDALVPVYTFVPPDQFEKMALSKHFELLQRPDKVKADTGSVAQMRLAGKMRRLYDAEKVRGMDGAELTLPQFEQYIQYLQEQYPAWMLK